MPRTNDFRKAQGPAKAGHYVGVFLLLFGLFSYLSAQKFIGIDDDPQLGASDAKVTIIEFADFQCPNCRAFWRDTLPRIKKEYVDTGKVRIVFRDFPIQEIHPEATITAIAAECADDQGKYFEFHDKVYREQDRRGRDIVRYRVDELKRWGADIGLDVAAFNECVDSERYKDEVAKDYMNGTDVGINGTPVFFINGRLIAGAQSFGNFRRVIEEELKKVGPAKAGHYESRSGFANDPGLAGAHAKGSHHRLHHLGEIAVVHAQRLSVGAGVEHHLRLSDEALFHEDPVAVHRAEGRGGTDLEIGVQIRDFVLPGDAEGLDTGQDAEPLQVYQVMGRHQGLHGAAVGYADHNLHRTTAGCVRNRRYFLGGVGWRMPIHQIRHTLPFQCGGQRRGQRHTNPPGSPRGCTK